MADSTGILWSWFYLEAADTWNEKPASSFGRTATPRLCRLTYCNAERAGGFTGPLCPHCDQIVSLAVLVDAVGVPRRRGETLRHG